MIVVSASIPLAELPGYVLQEERGKFDQLPHSSVDFARGHVDVVVLNVAAPLLRVLERGMRAGADHAVLTDQLERLDRRGSAPVALQPSSRHSSWAILTQALTTFS